jgi:hypothetical protein
MISKLFQLVLTKGGGMVGFIYRIRSNLNIEAAKSQKKARVKNQHEWTIAPLPNYRERRLWPGI